MVTRVSEFEPSRFGKARTRAEVYFEHAAAEEAQADVLPGVPSINIIVSSHFLLYSKFMRKNQKGFSHVELLVILSVIIIVIGVGYYVASRPKSTKPARIASRNSSQTDAVVNSSYKPSAVIPLGSAATDGTFTIKVLGVKDNPTVTGDKPDEGTHYFEVDLLVSTAANKDNYALDLSYTANPKADQGTTDYYGPADFETNTPDKLDPNKNIQIPGKQSIETAVPSDGTASTVRAYVIFQIPTADNGSGTLAWLGLDNQWRYFNLR